MSISQDDFISKTGADLVGDRLIVGSGSKRRYVGSIADSTFTLNEEGSKIAEIIESGGDIVAACAGDAQPDEEVSKPVKKVAAKVAV